MGEATYVLEGGGVRENTVALLALEPVGLLGLALRWRSLRLMASWLLVRISVVSVVAMVSRDHSLAIIFLLDDVSLLVSQALGAGEGVDERSGLDSEKPPLEALV